MSTTSQQTVQPTNSPIWQLVGVSEALAELDVALTAQMSIGRDATNDLVLGSSQISRHHAKIYVTDAGVVVEDLNSSNGTFINDTPLQGKSAPLTEVTAIRFASLAFQLKSNSQVNSTATDAGNIADVHDVANTQTLQPANSEVEQAAKVKTPAVSTAATNPIQQSDSQRLVMFMVIALIVLIALGVLFFFYGNM